MKIKNNMKVDQEPYPLMAGSIALSKNRKLQREAREAAVAEVNIIITSTRKRRTEASPGASRPKIRRLSSRLEAKQKAVVIYPSPAVTPTKGKGRPGKRGSKGKLPPVLTPGERLENEVNELFCTFGDCDPDHIRAKLELLTGDPNRYAAVYEDLAAGGYPTLRERLQKQYNEHKQNEMANQEPTIDTLITRYTDTEGLQQESRHRKSVGSDILYNNHAVPFVANRCIYLPVPYIKKVLNKHQSVVPAYEQLNAENNRRQLRPNASGRRGTYLRKPRDVPLPLPEEACIDFKWDSVYLERHPEIQEYKEQQEASHTLRYMKAKSQNQLVECPVCVDLYLPEDMKSCPSGHQFCARCIHLTVKEQLSQGLSTYSCLEPHCDHHVELHTLSQVLPLSLYRKVENKVQEELIRQAEIPGLTSCPSCPFAVVLPEEARGSVLQCENPQCLAATCRFCKDVAHPPFTCEQRATAKFRLRQHIENKMAEAIIRVCGKCKNRFVKAGGCNRMVCPNCQTPMCYVCGENLTNGYSHFNNNNGRCRVLDENLVHENDLTEALPTAEKEFLQANKEAKDISLGFDPIKDWKAAHVPAALPNHMFGLFQQPQIPVQQAQLQIPVQQAQLQIPVQQAQLQIPVQQAQLQIPVQQAQFQIPVQQAQR